MTFEEFLKSKDGQAIAELYRDTNLYHHSRVWSGKSYPLLIQASKKGVDLLYLDNIFFVDRWGRTAVDGKVEIPENILTAFVEDAKAVARQFYAKVSYLAGTEDQHEKQ